ncbi:acyl carrier protein [Cryptococcus neoformans]|nr:acyl carrier protein [Cryptococcus neoformans var. grubii Ze90-1]OXH34298.1 acyl carrier protein [Cryptococcus neoformans var. grubii]
MYRSIPLFRSAFPHYVRRSMAISYRPKPVKLFGKTSFMRNFADGQPEPSALTKDEITDMLLRVLNQFKQIDSSKLTGNASFTTDLGFDSLDHSELIMSVEETFDIDVADNDICELDSMDKTVDYISKSLEGGCSKSVPWSDVRYSATSCRKNQTIVTSMGNVSFAWIIIFWRGDYDSNANNQEEEGPIGVWRRTSDKDGILDAK